jgi:integrase
MSLEGRAKMTTRRGRGEGSIYKRESDGKWVGTVNLGYGPDGKRKRKTVYGKTRREVAEVLKALLRDQQIGKPLATSERLTIGSYLASWLKTVRDDIRPSTFIQYEVSVRCHLTPSLGRVQLTKLTPQQVREFVAAKIEAGLSPTTANLARAVLRRALEFAVEDGLIYRNPAKVMRQKGATSGRPKFKGQYLTEEEARTFLNTIKDHRLEALYSTALALGLRRGEALALRWCDVDLEQGLLRVTGTLCRGSKGTGIQRLPTPKTKESERTIRLPAPLLAKLRVHRIRQMESRLLAGTRWRGNPWDLVFTSTVGTAIDPRNVNRQFDALLSKAGLRHIRVHDARHTAAVLMLAQDIPLKVVSDILGHANIRITADTYAHVLPRQEQHAADTMGELLWGA